jgi:hypothetical protein
VRCSLAVAFFGSFFGKGKKNRKAGHWALVIGHWSLVISKEAKAEKGRKGNRERIAHEFIRGIELRWWDK